MRVERRVGSVKKRGDLFERGMGVELYARKRSLSGLIRLSGMGFSVVCAGSGKGGAWLFVVAFLMQSLDRKRQRRRSKEIVDRLTSCRDHCRVLQGCQDQALNNLFWELREICLGFYCQLFDTIAGSSKSREEEKIKHQIIHLLDLEENEKLKIRWCLYKWEHIKELV